MSENPKITRLVVTQKQIVGTTVLATTTAFVTVTALKALTPHIASAFGSVRTNVPKVTVTK